MLDDLYRLLQCEGLCLKQQYVSPFLLVTCLSLHCMSRQLQFDASVYVYSEAVHFCNFQGLLIFIVKCYSGEEIKEGNVGGTRDTQRMRNVCKIFIKTSDGRKESAYKVQACT
jgi:hypothetical protein